MFYYAGQPYLLKKDPLNDKDIMQEYPGVPFYQTLTRVQEGKRLKEIIQTHENNAFDLEYVKTRGIQSTVFMDSMKTVMNSIQLAYMNKELRKGEFLLVKDLMNMLLPLYKNLYKDMNVGLFAVPSIIENEGQQYSFGVSAIIKWEDGEIQYLNTLIMDEIGFIEETDPGIPWFLVDGVMEQKNMPEELKTLFDQINASEQNEFSEHDEYIHYQV